MKNLIKSIVLAMTIGLVSFSTSAVAEDARDEKVQFTHGSSDTTIKATISGWESVNYKLRARAGQSMIVVLNTSNDGNYFNIFTPGKGREMLPCS